MECVVLCPVAGPLPPREREGPHAQQRFLRNLLMNAGRNVRRSEKAHVAAEAGPRRGWTIRGPMQQQVAEQQGIADVQFGARRCAVKRLKFEPGVVVVAGVNGTQRIYAL